jgi:protocatechuate 3,4-dioxygenase beta subunit
MIGQSRVLQLPEVLIGPTGGKTGHRARRATATRRSARREALKVEELEIRLVPTLLGQQIFPLDYPWNQNISNAPVAANSASIIAQIGASTRLTPNWGADNPDNGSSPLYGIPYNVVHGNSTGKVSVIIDNYPDESDIVPVPIPANAVLEGDYQNGPNPNGAGYNPNQRGDSHMIVWDEDNNIAYELFGVSRPSDPTLFPNMADVELPHTDDLWHAAQETVWNMNSDTFRTLGETSADAAGLSILAGLARPDEGLTVAQGGQGVINHALRVTLPAGDLTPQYIYPASHMISVSGGANNLPLGSRLRLENTPAIDTLISNMPPESQILATTMQQYGLIVADVGSAMYVSGASASVDANNNINLTWDLNDIFASNGLEALNAGDFQVVNLTPVVTGLSASNGAAGDTIIINGQNFSGAAGNLSVFFGSTPSNSVKGLSDTQISVLVPSGTGTVDVTVQSGVNETDNISSNPNANVNAPIFGYGTSATSPSDVFTFTTTITGDVFNDLNGNGVQEAGEPGLQGWTVQLLDSSSNVVASTLTDANGNYTIANIGAGTYTVQEVPQPGYVQTTPALPGTYNFTTSGGDDILGLNFGNSQPGGFTGTAYVDTNGNGTRDAGEPALANWKVDLINSGGTVVATAITGSNGHYTFKNVAPGAYTIAEEVHAGWVVTQPGAPGTYTLNTVSGTTVGSLDFGDFKTISAQGTIFNDVNGNGTQDTGEPGLQGWIVGLRNASGGVVATQTTDSNGHYVFTGIGPGAYSVGQAVQDGWVQTRPGYPLDFSFTTKSGQNLSSMRFGDHASPDLHPLAAIDNGQAGYSETGSWSTVGGGFNGSNRVATTTQGSANTDTATYDFTGLAAGQYDVYVTFFGKHTYSSAAKFSVSDGGTHLGNAFINESILVTQTQGAGPRAQGSFGGVGWLGLGTFSISSGELVVVLGNKAVGNFVDADGVLIVKEGAIHVGYEPQSLNSSVATNAELPTNLVSEPNNTLWAPSDQSRPKPVWAMRSSLLEDVGTRPTITSAVQTLALFATARKNPMNLDNEFDGLFVHGAGAKRGLGIV